MSETALKSKRKTKEMKSCNCIFNQNRFLRHIVCNFRMEFLLVIIRIFGHTGKSIPPRDIYSDILNFHVIQPMFPHERITWKKHPAAIVWGLYIWMKIHTRITQWIKLNEENRLIKLQFYTYFTTILFHVVMALQMWIYCLKCKGCFKKKKILQIV